MTVRSAEFCHDPLTSVSPPSWPGARMSSRSVWPMFVHPDGTVPALANVASWVVVGFVAVPTTPVQMYPTDGIKTAESVCATGLLQGSARWPIDVQGQGKAEAQDVRAGWSVDTSRATGTARRAGPPRGPPPHGSTCSHR